LGEEKPITVAEANAFYGEEKAAWEHGARLLDERGFTRWFRFGQVCEKSLATYERAIQSCCVGWRAPPLNDFLDPLVARDPPSVALKPLAPAIVQRHDARFEPCRGHELQAQ